MEDHQKWTIKYQGCWYSKRLLDKLRLLNQKSPNKVNISMVQKAIYYATKYHYNQKRQSGEPYHSHPLEVAYMVSDYLFKTDIIVTAILHDTIEDTTLNFEMIHSIFGKIIAEQVMDLTRIKECGRKISSAEMVDTLFIQKKYDVLLIKQFDRLHNIQTIGFKSPEKSKKIIDETVQTFIMLAEFLKTPEIAQEITELCLKAQQSIVDQRPFIFSDDQSLLSLVFQNDLMQKQNL